MFLSGLKCLSRLERQVKFAKNRCCKIKPVAVTTYFINLNKTKWNLIYLYDTPKIIRCTIIVLNMEDMFFICLLKTGRIMSCTPSVSWSVCNIIKLEHSLTSRLRV